MRIELNGTGAIVPDGATVAAAIEAAGPTRGPRGVAVAVDGEVVPAAEWDDHIAVRGPER